MGRIMGIVAVLCVVGCVNRGLPFQTVQRSTVESNTDFPIHCVVRVLTFEKDGSPHGSGSGVLILGGDRIITAHHVIAGSEAVFIDRYPDLSPTQCSVLLVDEPNDLALLGTRDAVSGETVGLCTNGVRLYTKCNILGYQLGLPEPTLTEGLVQSNNELVGSQLMTRVSAPGYYGASGGGLFVIEDGRWKLQGIVQRVYTDHLSGAVIYHMVLACKLESLHLFISPPSASPPPPAARRSHREPSVSFPA